MTLLINGERVENAEFEQERRALRRALAEQMPDEPAAERETRARDWSRENVIERVLLKQAAMRDPEPISAEAIDQAAGPAHDTETRRDIEVRLRVERWMARLTSHAAKPRRKDLVDYYKKNSDRFLAQESVHAGHIVKNVDENTSEQSAREAVEQIRERLHAGEPFEALADESSDCPGRGGDLGTFVRGRMVPEFDAVVFAMTPDDISDVFRTSFGYHIVKLYSRRAEGVLPFDEVSSQIEELLFAQKKQKVIDQHLDSLRAKADIKEVF